MPTTSAYWTSFQKTLGSCAQKSLRSSSNTRQIQALVSIGHVYTVLDYGANVVFDFVENNEANNLAAQVEGAIKAKASQEEILNILKEAPGDEEQGGSEQFSPLKVIIAAITKLSEGPIKTLFFFPDFCFRDNSDASGQQELLALLRSHRKVPPESQGTR